MSEPDEFAHLPPPPTDGAPPPDGDPTKRSTARAVTILIVATALGIFMLGFPAGILPACATLIFFLAPNETSRSASLAALVLLAVAAIATMAEGSIHAEDLNLRFARDREIATTAAAATGGLLGIAVLTGAVVERSKTRAERWTRAPRHPRLERSPDTRVLVGTLALGAIVRLAAAPGPLGPDASLTVQNLANGVSYQSGLADRVLVPPLAPILVSVLPVGNGLLLLAVGLSTIAAAVHLGRRLNGDRGALLAGLMAACLPSLVGQRLPEGLATMFVTLGVLAGWPALLTTKRALMAGGFLSLAVLAEPTALLAVGLLVAWVATSERADRISYALFLLVPLVLVTAPLLQWSLNELGTALPRSPADAAASSGALRVVTYLIDAAAGVACFIAATDRRNRLVFRLLPALALLAGLFTGSSSGLWGWSAGLVAVGAASFLAGASERRSTAAPTDAMGEVATA